MHLRGGVWLTKDRSRFGGRFDKYEIKANEPAITASRTGGGWAEKYQPEIKAHRESSPGGSRKNYDQGANIQHWDVAPPPEYFIELFRVSKNQIIWGGNYFALPPTRCFLVWRKLTISEKFTMAMCEYAWTSFNDNAKWIELAPQGNAKEVRFHPTQKPVALYTWILNNYAKKGDKILDTHLGSQNSVKACIKLGFEYMGFEIDKTYFDLGCKSVEDFKAQTSIFDLDKHESVFDAVIDARQERF